MFCFRDNCIWIGCLKLSLLSRENLSSALNMLTNSLRNLDISKRDFFSTQFPWQWSINMLKVLPFRFQQCLVTFRMLILKGSSKRGLFRDLFLARFSEPVISEIQQLWHWSFLWKSSNSKIDFKNEETNWANLLS